MQTRWTLVGDVSWGWMVIYPARARRQLTRLQRRISHRIATRASAHTFEFEGMPAHVMLERAMFEELGDKTTMTFIDVFQTVEDRDSAFHTGMKKGAIESTDRFAKLLQKLKGEGKANA